MTHIRIWKFRPPTGGEEAFAKAYGADGVWARLFREADGFIGTRLLRPAEDGGWWMTIDRWASEAHFAAFQRDFGEAYRRLDAELEGIAGEEEFIGAFEDADEAIKAGRTAPA